jgi:hypothetical protein
MLLQQSKRASMKITPAKQLSFAGVLFWLTASIAYLGMFLNFTNSIYQ